MPFTASFWSASDPLTTLAISPARVENLGRQCGRWWEREFLLPDFDLFRDLARAERPVASLSRATNGQLGRSVRYRELHRELGYGDELRAVFRSGDAAWGFVSLWREDGQRPFSAAEERLVAELSAPIAEAFRRAALLQATGSPASAEAPGLLVFNQHGVLESFNEQAQAWLRELPPTSLHDPDGCGVAIPTGIRSVVAVAHAIAAGVERGAARARIHGRSGRWLVIHAFPLHGAQDEASKTAVVIEPAKASEIAPIIVEAYDLGPREQQITRMIARGLTTAQIAQQLFLSQHTVRDYVKSVFEKVGVSSRGELVARLFAEHYAEPLRDSVVAAPECEPHMPGS
ncbi:MAG TPA: helix-turn-helix transcriptional regulator [Chloroflexota bacterium]|nr:helix-turn-helix transcriptional regulator [Chloroflexota bacterium]